MRLRNIVVGNSERRTNQDVIQVELLSEQREGNVTDSFREDATRTALQGPVEASFTSVGHLLASLCSTFEEVCSGIQPFRMCVIKKRWLADYSPSSMGERRPPARRSPEVRGLSKVSPCSTSLS